MNTTTDVARFRRELLRWLILLTLNNARPIGANEGTILMVSRAEFPDATRLELRRELDYLSDRELVNIVKQPSQSSAEWIAKLTRHGVDVAEYAVECEAGIARPEKYW